MEIKHYEDKYRENVQDVCINTAPPSAKTNKNMHNFIVSYYCDYYIEQEAENVFVLVDENDVAQGYILCAPDYTKYEMKIVPYLKKIGFVFRVAAKGGMKDHKDWSEQYPAHLHIDINDGFRGSGNGTRLVETLKEHLRQRQIPGLMLVVGEENKNAIAFYKKNGFAELKRYAGRIAMGCKL